MIRPDVNVTLRPYKIYKNDHSKDVPIGYGEDKRGKFLKFQALDVNKGENGNLTGYAYINVYTDIPLKLNDIVTVKEILYVQIKRMGLKNIVIIGMTIKQTNAGVIQDEHAIDDVFKNVDF